MEDVELQRPTAEEMLKRISKDQPAVDNHLGKLKIFFGYAAGVGKTYAMLQAAHQAKNHGIDVVLGYVEPHTRPETMALVEGLEQLPLKEIQYRNITLKEFDIDACLKRKPQLVLIDELAHNNAEGKRHLKRYQDIEEILKAGIDVYTTVNVQHLESLNDQVSAITGVVVRERIPDSVFDNADQVELVDIEPNDLIERLQEGKVYKERQAGAALQNFFKVSNLIALREISLRRCADRVNKESEKVAPQQSGYYTNEHILVCLSSSPSNPKIIRTASRLVSAFKAHFTALYVESTPREALSKADNHRLEENIKLAKQLGAVIETVYDDDIATAINNFAKEFRVTKIVMGRTGSKPKLFNLKPTLIEKLTRLSNQLDIYIIPDKKAQLKRPKPNIFKRYPFKITNFFKDLFITFATTTLATLISFIFFNAGLSETNIVVIYILGILVNAIITKGVLFAFFDSLISVLAFNYFFTEPRFSFHAYDVAYPVIFLTMLLSGFISATLAKKLKSQTKKSMNTAYRTKSLFDMNRLLQNCETEDEIISVTSQQIQKLLKRNLVFYLYENGQLSEPRFGLYQEDDLEGEPETKGAGANEEAIKARLSSSNEKGVANWVALNQTSAGAGTETLSNAVCRYYTVSVNQNVYGVLGIEMQGEHSFVGLEFNLLVSILGEAAFAIERLRITKEREEARTIAKNEQLKTNILRAISHDLRTPLAGISGNADLLVNQDNYELTDIQKKKIAEDIHDDSMYLINLVENLLSVTRIEEGNMRLRMNAEVVDEVIDEAVKHVHRYQSSYELTVQNNDDILMANMDARLIVQVIINLIDNAIKYSPEKAHITVSSKRAGSVVQIAIADNGCGVPDVEKENIFEMFYSAHNKVSDSRRSLGLGLALCKSIVNSHGGKIWVEDNQPKGSKFVFSLPATDINLEEIGALNE